MVHLSVPEEQHPSSVAGRLYRVGDHQNGLPGAVQFSEQLQQGVGGPGVQSAGGFVCQNQLGVRDEGPGHSSPLLLAAGDLIGVFRQDVRDAQLICDGAELLLHLPVVCARQHQGQIDVVLKGEGVQQVEVLEHEPQVGPAEGRQIPLPDGREGPALQ